MSSNLEKSIRKLPQIWSFANIFRFFLRRTLRTLSAVQNSFKSDTKFKMIKKNFLKKGHSDSEPQDPDPKVLGNDGSGSVQYLTFLHGVGLLTSWPQCHRPGYWAVWPPAWSPLCTCVNKEQGCRADPRHFNADSDPAFHFNADPDPVFHLNVAGSWSSFSSKWWESATNGLFSPPGLQCERLRPSTAFFWASKAFKFGL